jgi:hypothetical protein
MQLPIINHLASKQKRYLYWRDHALPRITPDLTQLFQQKLQQYRETLQVIATAMPESEQSNDVLNRSARSLLCLERELENLENEARLAGRSGQELN